MRSKTIPFFSGSYLYTAHFWNDFLKALQRLVMKNDDNLDILNKKITKLLNKHALQKVCALSSIKKHQSFIASEKPYGRTTSPNLAAGSLHFCDLLIVYRNNTK